jgi:hypothetical protein
MICTYVLNRGPAGVRSPPTADLRPRLATSRPSLPFPGLFGRYSSLAPPSSAGRWHSPVNEMAIESMLLNKRARALRRQDAMVSRYPGCCSIQNRAAWET